MHDRFSLEKEPSSRFPSIVYFLFCSILFLALIYGTSKIAKDNEGYQQNSLICALRRDIAQCYAIEGFYPPDLSYLEEHYGLTYDTSAFYIDYSAFGSNLYPDVTVIGTESGTATTIR